MPKFLADCHYNEEEISRHLKKKIVGYWPVQMNGNKFATGEILRKPVEVVEGRIWAGGAQKSPELCTWEPVEGGEDTWTEGGGGGGKAPWNWWQVFGGWSPDRQLFLFGEGVTRQVSERREPKVCYIEKAQIEEGVI